MKLLATYPSERAARKAVRALQDAGIPPSEIRMNAPVDDRDELRAEQQDEARAVVFGPGAVLATGATKKAAVGGTLIGIPIGALIGLILGVIVFPTHLFGILACVIGFGVAGWVALGLFSLYRAAEQEQEATEKELSEQVVVGVIPKDDDEAARAEMILQSTEPHRLDRAS
jgi:predicted lipid-binding transport protein (Tim44 family)